MVDPHFKMLWNEDIPVIEHKDDQGHLTTIDVIAGGLESTQAPDPTPNSWAADPQNAVGVFTVKMEANATWTLPKTDLASNRSLFFYKGESLSIDGKRVSVEHAIRIRPDQDIQVQNGPQDAYMLILQGRPINEPVVKHGPFVMNTEEEIRETMKEYGRCKNDWISE